MELRRLLVVWLYLWHSINALDVDPRINALDVDPMLIRGCRSSRDAIERMRRAISGNGITSCLALVDLARC
jgi:hypothetical protein